MIGEGARRAHADVQNSEREDQAPERAAFAALDRSSRFLMLFSPTRSSVPSFVASSRKCHSRPQQPACDEAASPIIFSRSLRCSSRLVKRSGSSGAGAAQGTGQLTHRMATCPSSFCTTLPHSGQFVRHRTRVPHRSEAHFARSSTAGMTSPAFSIMTTSPMRMSLR
jgi:hypothetical protein